MPPLTFILFLSGSRDRPSRPSAAPFSSKIAAATAIVVFLGSALTKSVTFQVAPIVNEAAVVAAEWVLHATMITTAAFRWNVIRMNALNRRDVICVPEMEWCDPTFKDALKMCCGALKRLVLLYS